MSDPLETATALLTLAVEADGDARKLMLTMARVFKDEPDALSWLTVHALALLAAEATRRVAEDEGLKPGDVVHSMAAAMTEGRADEQGPVP